MRYPPEPTIPSDAPAVGIVLANVGSPSAPTSSAVRAYLRGFLADPRVVEYPRLPWWFLRTFLILPFRPRRSAALYRRIWTAEGSPLLAISRRQADKLESELENRFGYRLPVVAGMGYGEPSIGTALNTLRRAGCRRVLVLPLFPQHSGTTTGSVFDAVARELSRWRRVPEIRTVSDYHDHPAYIRALAQSLDEVWRAGGKPQKLLLSFHSLPVRYVEAGDPYRDQCRVTAAMLADSSELDSRSILTGFQSRFGREPWIGPATDALIEELGREGVDGLDVVCPGFAADCLETLEEIALTGREIFERSGGRSFRYITALNDRPDHISMLAEIATEHLGSWVS
jgi:ferrochelatase